LAVLAAACGGEKKKRRRRGRGGAAATTAKKPGTAAGADKAAEGAKKEETEYEFGEGFDGRDPFRSYLAEFVQTAEAGEKGMSELRTPLENYELTELRPIALITGTPVPKAMVTDPSGLGHVIRPGTRIGRRGGKVVRISTNAIVVRHIEEEMGTVKESVLKLHEGDDRASGYDLSITRHDLESEERRKAQEEQGILKGLTAENMAKVQQAGLEDQPPAETQPPKAGP